MINYAISHIKLDQVYLRESTQMYINPGLTIKIMAAAKKQTKQDLENKIAELEAKLNQLSTQLKSKPAEVKPAEVKPAERPAATTKPKGVLPKGMGQAPPQQQSTNVEDDGKSRGEKLVDYESDYLQRIEQQKIDDEKAFDELLEAEAKSRATASRGTLPKGFEPKQESEPEAPKASRGTLPKGF